MVRCIHIISGDLWAGAEVMAYLLIKGLLKYHDLEIMVIVLNKGRLTYELRRIGIEVHVVNENSTSFLNSISLVNYLLKQFRPNIIHTHRYKENILAYMSRRGLEKVKLITTQHGMPENIKKCSLKHQLVLRYNFYILKRHFDRVVAVSNDIGIFFLRNLGFENRKLNVIHNGIEIPNVPIGRNSEGIFIIGSCGRFFPVKDYSLMIKVAKECIKNNNNVFFKLAGDGPEMQRLRDLVMQLGIDEKFTFTGRLDDMKEFYCDLKLFINTSIHEGIPMSVLEAMSYGLPIVAPKVGGFKEIIDDGTDGFLIETRDPEAFAEKCLLFVNDENRWRKMSKAARQKIVNHFSASHMAEKYYNLYLKVLYNR